MTKQEIRIMSAPPEVWDAAKTYEPTNAYKETGRKPMYPIEDYMELYFTDAEKLYRRGLSCSIVHPRDAALPVFRAAFKEGQGKSKMLSDLLQPVYNKASDRELCIYGLEVLFVCNSSHIACDILYHYSDHSGGGYEYVGTVAIMADGDYFYTYPHFMECRAHEEFGLYDYTSITGLCNWLGYLWRGIQDQIINRPERIQYFHRKIKGSGKTIEYEKNHSGKRIAKVQRIINICMDDADIIAATGKHIYLPLWSVAGHWRVTKTGKRVWVKPFYKGKDRNKPNAVFSAKEYRFDKEVVDHA